LRVGEEKAIKYLIQYNLQKTTLQVKAGIRGMAWKTGGWDNRDFRDRRVRRNAGWLG
jgi:AAA+ superfamily predicted ATPase